MHLSTEPDYGRSLFVLLAFGFAVACFSYCTAAGGVGFGIPTAGATAPPDTVTPVLALARLCVNEGGMRAYTHDDCAAIHAVLTFRREHVPAYRGLTYLEALHRYSRRAVVERGHRGRPWIVGLWPDAREPARWPARLRWASRHGRWWRETYAHAAAVLRGDEVTICYGVAEDGGPIVREPHGWARGDVRPADRSAQEIDCGRTRNTFWSVPAYRERWPIAAAAGRRASGLDPR